MESSFGQDTNLTLVNYVNKGSKNLKFVTLTMNPSIDLSTSVDRLQPFSKLRCAVPEREPGGGGINVARVLDRFKCEVVAAYVAGGVEGALLQQLVERTGLRDLVIKVEESTREDVTIFERATNKQFRFVMPGPHLKETIWQEVLQALEGCDVPHVIVASGSLPGGVPEDFYAMVARHARAMGVRLALDASGPALKAALDEKPWLIKPNLKELRELTGEALATTSARANVARALIAAGKTEIVALTLAEEGGLLATREGVWVAVPPKIKVVSTVGAGDSFLALLVMELTAGAAPDVALVRAVAAGSAVLLRPGTDLCWPEDVERLSAEVSVRRLLT